MDLLETRISIQKWDEYAGCIHLSSSAFPEKCRYSDSSIEETTRGELLCSFSGFKSVYALLVQETKCVAIRAQHTMPAKIKRHTIGHRAGIELLFVSLEDKTVRAFSMLAGALHANSQIAFTDTPLNLLWLAERELLLVELRDANNQAQTIDLLRVWSSDNTLHQFGRALDLDAPFTVVCWLQTAKNEMLIFDGIQRDLLRFSIQKTDTPKLNCPSLQ